MSRLTDPTYQQTEGYRDASNLNARAQLHRRYSTNRYPWQRWVWDQFQLPAAGRVLDIGCGPGGLWAQNRERVPAGWEIVLADFSPGMVQKARQNLVTYARPLAYAVADAQALPFADERFEAVIANQVLYHVPDRGRALSEIRRVLRPGGRLYTATQGHNYLRELRDLLAQVGVDAGSLDAASEFGLENGVEQLMAHLSQVLLYRREDALIVTEAEPLVAYALSTSCAAALRPKLDAFRRLVEREIASRGSVHMSKESGLFEALKV